MRLYLLTAVLISLFMVSGLLGQVFEKHSDLTESSKHGYEIAIGDFDGNGLDDVAYSNSHINKLAYKPQISPQEYGVERVISMTDVSVSHVYAADVDLDGLVDIMWIGRNQGAIGWHKNLGDGAFSENNTIEHEYENFYSGEISDIDLDGDIDIIVNPYVENLLVIYSNDGMGNFSPIPVPLNVNPYYEFKVADIFNAPLPELIVFNQSNGDIIAYENMGGENYEPQSIASTSYNTYMGLLLRDMDLDGDTDLVSSGQFIGSQDPSQINWHENTGGYSFTNHLITEDISHVKSTGFIDVDLDGLEDLLVTHTQGANSWLKNEGSGEFYNPTSFDLPTGTLSTIYTHDLDMNGLDDMLILSHNFPMINVFHGNEENNFESNTRLTPGMFDPLASEISDLNGDGILDITYRRYGNQGGPINDLGYALGLGDLEYSTLIGLATPGHILDHATLDADGDGDLDLVIGLSNLPTGTIQWAANDGQGVFSSFTPISIFPGQVRFLHLEDVDSDGNIDIIAHYEDLGMYWHRNEGDGFFGEATSLLADPTNSIYELISFNSDGDNSIDFIARKSNSIILIERPEGLIVSSTLLDQEEIGEVHLIDFNSDGFLDILYSNSVYTEGFNRLVLYGSETGFSSPLDLGSSPLRSSLVFDIDNDGDIDIIGSDYYSPLFWLENVENGALNLHVDVEITYDNNNNGGLFSMNAADLDGDSDIDLINTYLPFSSSLILENVAQFGCTDPAACNYDPEALTDNGACCFGSCGCTNQEAVNYNPDADCDDGSCRFPFTGIVYFDENGDGIMDANENGLANQHVILSPSGMELITNELGIFNTTITGQDEFTATVQSNSNFPIITTPLSISFDADVDFWNSPVAFGLAYHLPDTPEPDPIYDITTSIYSATQTYPCDEVVRHDAYIYNTGNTAVSGVVSLAFDSLFQEVIEVSTIDSMNVGVYHFGFEELLPFQIMTFSLELLTPNAELLGNSLSYQSTAIGLLGDSLVASDTDEKANLLTCSYDPNDKQVIPAGYTESHFVLEDERLEYVIRFQNTGNAPAADVVIRDTLDASLDLSTFELNVNSHSVFTSIDLQTREVVFIFADIQLPDSVNNEPESHGLVSFSIEPIEGIEQGSTIHNQVAIYFDNNPPIITNETWTTIFHCDQMALPLNTTDLDICEGESLTIDALGDYIESYIWSLNEDTLSTDASITYLSEMAGAYPLTLDYSNPLCSSSSTYSVEVEAYPDVTISFMNGELTVSAGDGYTYQWYLNGSPLINGHANTWTPLVDGNYSVEITSARGCFASSETYLFVTGLEDLQTEVLNIFPNPFTNQAIIELAASGEVDRILLLDQSGKIVRSIPVTSNQKSLTFERGDLASGRYILRVVSENGSSNYSILVE